MELATSIANWVAALANIYMALRLLTFRRGKRRYRRGVAFLAWLLINLTLCMAAWLILAGFTHSVIAHLYAGLCVGMAWLFLRHKGNLGAFF
ncbi:phage holin family protein [Marinimicrobium sp. ARAG 43.8]|uniref:phage holin family protein n=1 Tax=Marinimicrobium sp. ARAG 43.8 TaxID=3418719 RepID=UPI003CEEDA6F